ncbi:MAG TPA: ABC transporter permease, partial [Candidatus Tumulicola sp.]|nr:ABC transporter permease [Candidatus Tumulicola sp.]
LTGAGFAYGAIIAAIALGVVLTYRGSGIVNFANGAIAMYVAYVYSILRTRGELFLPPLPNPLKIFGSGAPNIPTAISFGADNMQFWPALLISLGFCVLLGLALHFLVFRPLRTAPPLAKVIASVGVFVFLQATIIRRYNTTSQVTPALGFVHKSTQVNLGIFKMPADQLFVAVIVIVFATLLWALFKFTRFGLATRAAAENEKGAIVLGYSPDFLAGANWVLSMLITGLLGIFVASTQTSIDPLVLAALIVPALTAALVGSFASFGRTTAAAFVLGMQIPLVQYISNKSWFPTYAGSAWPGFEYLLPLLGIVLVLFLAGSTLPERGAITSGRLPFSPTPPKWAIRIAGPLLIVLTVLVGLFWFGPDYRLALTNTLVGIIICLSVVIITGFVGQISLAQLSFSGIAAFTVSKLSADHGWPFPWPILAGAFAAMILGLLVALPALRVRGVNLAIVTLGFAVAVDHVVFSNSAVTGGYNGAKV